METLVIHPENKHQLAALQALIKSWNISFEKYPYNPAFINEIKQREKNIEDGGFTKIEDPKKLWDNIL